MGKYAVFFTLFLLFISINAYSAQIQLGFLTIGEEMDDVSQAALEWVEKSYSTTLVIPDADGQFASANGSPQSLDSFPVLWLHYTEADTLPGVFLSNATKDAVMDYLESGGTMFLSGLGLHYTFDLEVEIGAEPRVFSPLGKGPPEIGIVPTPEGAAHPIFDGFDTDGPIYLCSMAQDGFTSDFHSIPGEVSGLLLATKTRGGGAGAGERPVVEFDVGAGKIITLGHHNAVYTDEDSEEGENLRLLTANIIEYMAQNSEFLAVKPVDKIAVRWAEIK